MSLVSYAPFRISVSCKQVLLLILLVHTRYLAAIDINGEINESKKGGGEQISFSRHNSQREISESIVSNIFRDQNKNSTVDSHSFRLRETGSEGVVNVIKNKKKEEEKRSTIGREKDEKEEKKRIILGRGKSEKEVKKNIILREKSEEENNGSNKGWRREEHVLGGYWTDALVSGGDVDVMVRPVVTPVPAQGHTNNLTMELIGHNATLTLSLHPTRDLLGATYHDPDQDKAKHGGSVTVCEYQGEVQGVEGSWAALSLCPVIRGMIVSGSGAVWVEPGPGSEALGQPHRVFTPNLHHHSKTCGTMTKDVCKNNTSSSNSELADSSHSRYRRSLHRGLAWTNKTTRFVELVLVVDSSYYKHYRENTTQRCRAIINVANALFRKLDVVVVLTHIEIWKSKDEVEVEEDSDKTLSQMSSYRKNFLNDHPDIPCDNMQLLTIVDFEGKTIGKATMNGMCSRGDSVGVVQDTMGGVGGAGNTLAHEMGHNLGLRHDEDDEDCECPSNQCIMKSVGGGNDVSSVQWSTCSQRNLTRNLQSFMFDCLRNEPNLHSGSCGDGMVGDGEECDCGPPSLCHNPCCNPNTCRLRSNATCASGSCCDVKTCRPKVSSALCREARDECDAPEYCLGDSELCPPDAHMSDGTYCDGGEGHCYNGWCGSRELRCRAVWGESAQSGSTSCYRQLNKNGNSMGNCGRTYWDSTEYTPCDEGDILCGSLHCESKGGPLKSPPRVGQSQYKWHNLEFQQSGKCHVVIASESLLPSDWLVPDGAPCGSGKMCVQQRCVSVPVSPWVVGFWIFVVAAVILVFLLWDHIRWWWEDRGRACLSPHFPPCAACCDACCCPCMTRINRMLAAVLPSIGPVCKKTKKPPKPKKEEQTVANGTVANGTVPGQQSESTSPADAWGNSWPVPGVVTFAPNKGKGVGVIENGNVLPYNSKFQNHISSTEDWPLADKTSLTDSSSDSPQVDKKLLKHSENHTQNNWQVNETSSEFGRAGEPHLPDSPKIQPVRRAPSPPKKKVDDGEGRGELETRKVAALEDIPTDPGRPVIPPRPDFIPPRSEIMPARPEIPLKPVNLPGRPTIEPTSLENPSRAEVIVIPENLSRPDIPPRPEVILPLRPDIVLPSKPKPDVPPRP